jgi:hypothetical protein
VRFGSPENLETEAPRMSRNANDAARPPDHQKELLKLFGSLAQSHRQPRHAVPGARNVV